MADERKGYFATGRVSGPEPDPGGQMVELSRHPSAADAQGRAVTLLEAGIGAEVVAILPEAGAGEGWAVQVVRVDLARAAELTGQEGDAVPATTVDAADPNAASSLDADAKEPVPWKRIVLLFVIAMIVLPLLAFFITYQVVSGSCPDGGGVTTSSLIGETC